MVQYSITPWRSQSDLLALRRAFYPTGEPSPSSTASSKPLSDEQQYSLKHTKARAVSLVAIYSHRGNCPHLLESTALLISAQLSDYTTPVGPHLDASALKLAYSSAFCRFVTGLLDGYQSKKHKQSMYAIAKSIGLPSSWVELRHQCTHEGLPGLPRLRKAVEESLNWLWGGYWAGLGPWVKQETKLIWKEIQRESAPRKLWNGRVIERGPEERRVRDTTWVGEGRERTEIGCFKDRSVDSDQVFGSQTTADEDEEKAPTEEEIQRLSVEIKRRKPDEAEAEEEEEEEEDEPYMGLEKDHDLGEWDHITLNKELATFTDLEVMKTYLEWRGCDDPEIDTDQDTRMVFSQYMVPIELDTKMELLEKIRDEGDLRMMRIVRMVMGEIMQDGGDPAIFGAGPEKWTDAESSSEEEAEEEVVGGVQTPSRKRKAEDVGDEERRGVEKAEDEEMEEDEGEGWKMWKGLWVPKPIGIVLTRPAVERTR